MLLCVLNANAYIHTTIGLDTGRKHLFIIGHAGDLGTLFLRSVQTKIMRYKDMYPNDSIVVIGAAGLNKRISLIRNNFGHRIIESNRKKLSIKRLSKILKRLGNVQTVDFFSHSGATYGMGLEKNVAFKYTDSEAMSVFKRMLAPDAYVVLNGCNSGFVQAPKFSEILGVPVFGSLTSTDFQRIHNDGTWYNNNPGNYPEGGFSTKNEYSYSSEKNCNRNGGCLRMKPDNHSYSGHWGSYKVGLPYYRPFCSASVSPKDCAANIAQEIMLYPVNHVAHRSISREEYRDAVTEYMCPQDKSLVRYLSCKNYLLSNGRVPPVSKIFRGTMLHCNTQTCLFKVGGSGNRLKFSLKQVYGKKHDQMLVDYRRFVKAYDLFK